MTKERQENIRLFMSKSKFKTKFTYKNVWNIFKKMIQAEPKNSIKKIDLINTMKFYEGMIND